MIRRQIETKIKELIHRYPVVSVTGPRQSGKTTLLKSVFPEYRYVSLENKDIREFAISDPNKFLETYAPPVILDEVQRAPDLFSYIQTIVDATTQTGQYVLSGSQNFLLLSSIGQSLAGRVGLFKLLPFSIRELKAANGLPELDELLYQGCYPPIYDRQLPATTWYSDYVDTYLQRDVPLIKSITNMRSFRKFLTLCAVRSGQVVNYASLGRDCGVSSPTIQEWLSILEASYIVFFLHPYTTNVSSRVIKSPKLYFYDPGLLSFLLDIHSAGELVASPSRGAIFETLMVSEYVKAAFNQKEPFRGYFLRDRDGHEVDFVHTSPTGITTLIEMKVTKTISNTFFEGIRYFQAKTTTPYHRQVIYGGDDAQSRSAGEIISWREAV